MRIPFMSIPIRYVFCPILLILFCTYGCKQTALTEVETIENTTINISIVPGALATNSPVQCNAIVQPIPDMPYICIWNFRDSTGDHYTQNNATMIHYFTTPGRYLVRLSMLNVNTGDTIASIERPIDIMKGMDTPINEILQTMHRVSVVFIAKKQYTFDESHKNIEASRVNYSLSSGLTICGRTGVYQYSNSSNDYYQNSNTELSNQTKLLFRSDQLLDSLYLTSSTYTYGTDSYRKYWSSYSGSSLAIHKLPLISLTGDSIIFEASGEAVKEYCQMTDGSGHTEQGTMGESYYQLTSIDWQNAAVVPKLRVVLMK
jgi:hypothetical protein